MFYAQSNIMHVPSSHCNPGIEFSIIEKFVIPESRFGIGLTDCSLFWYS